MIQPNQLRIGNLVDVPNKNQSPFRVDYFDDIKIYKQNGTYRCEPFGDIPTHPLTWDLEQCSGIPLTPEILEKAGFEYDGIIYKKYNLFTIPEFSSEGELYYIQIGSLGNSQQTKVKHLHQLQNLYFALTGEELEIKL